MHVSCPNIALIGPNASVACLTNQAALNVDRFSFSWVWTAYLFPKLWSNRRAVFSDWWVGSCMWWAYLGDCFRLHYHCIHLNKIVLDTYCNNLSELKHSITFSGFWRSSFVLVNFSRLIMSWGTIQWRWATLLDMGVGIQSRCITGELPFLRTQKRAVRASSGWNQLNPIQMLPLEHLWVGHSRMTPIWMCGTIQCKGSPPLTTVPLLWVYSLAW